MSVLMKIASLLCLFKDVKVLHDIIDQVSDRPLSKTTGLSTFNVHDDDSDDEGPKLKEKVATALVKCTNITCVWDCCSLWIKIAEMLAFLVFDPFTELFITLCIAVNVIFMALDQYNIEYDDIGGM